MAAHFALAGVLFWLSPAMTAFAGGKVEVDKNIPRYQKVSGISGNLSSVGSDTMNNLMALWGEAFAKYYPNVKLQVEGKGSGTAPPALIAGTAQFAPMSRKMKDKEIDEFVKAFGYEPTAFGTSLDALAVYVNKDNPIKGLSLEQSDGIFSKTQLSGYKDCTTWGDLDMAGNWSNKPISLYGRNSASGTYGYFKEKALFKGDYKDTVKEQPGSASVVQGVSEDLYGIGYSGIGYMTSGVRAVPLARKEGETCVEPTMANVESGKYPLARFLYVYVNKEPGKELDPLVREFIKFIFSYEGQEIVVKDGYMPLSHDIVKKQLSQMIL